MGICGSTHARRKRKIEMVWKCSETPAVTSNSSPILESWTGILASSGPNAQPHVVKRSQGPLNPGAFRCPGDWQQENLVQIKFTPPGELLRLFLFCDSRLLAFIFMLMQWSTHS